MKVKTGIAIGMLVLGLAGCASWHSDWEAKCGPQIDPQLKPCSCMDPRTASCPPVPSDAKKPKNDAGTKGTP